MMRYISYIIIAVFFAACSGDVIEHKEVDYNLIQKQLLEANIKATSVESNQIDEYVKKKGLDVIKTKTGLRYQIYDTKEGENIVTKQKAVIKYKVTLLDGTECYSTKDEVEEFTVGKDYVESGLHEGITYMSKGDKAIIIIPSHLAHGTTGDFKKIPMRSTIVYDIELVDIK
jgi:FKBP-type peptidyl-prolyl cis-trans isomerase